MPKNMTEEQRQKWNEYQRTRYQKNKELREKHLEYVKTKTKGYSFSLSFESEKDMIAYLETKKPYYSYLKALVRADMELHAQKNDNIENK